MKEAIGTGSTVEEAKEAACRELGVESYEAEFEILELPTKKTFGIFGGSPAKVRAYLEDDPAEAAAEYLRTVLTCMGVPDVQIDIQRGESSAMLSLSGGDIGFIIGHRGETLDSLQYLAGLVANHGGGTGYYRIALDIGNYREKRRQTLEALGRKMAEKSLRMGRNMSLEPMNPYERRIIHTAVQTVEGVKSWSEGLDLDRHVVIGPVDGERNPRRTRPYGVQNRRDGRPRQGGYRGQRGPARPLQQKREEPAPAAAPKPEPKGALYEKVGQAAASGEAETGK